MANFIVQFPLKTEKYQEEILDRRFEIGRQIYNSLVNITQNHLILKPGNFSKIDPSKYPVSKMVFDLFGGIDWIAGIGVIGDFSFEQWDLFIKKSCENISLKELFELAEICSCIVSMHEKKKLMICLIFYLRRKIQKRF